MISDGAQIGSLRDGAKVDKSHSERNAHRLFNRYGLALKVPISLMEVPATAGSDGQNHASVPHLKLTDMLDRLLNQHEEVLFGGLRFGKAAENLLSEFWARFKNHQKEHVIFESIPESERCRCIPLMIHGDKGRTLQKTPILVLNFEVAHGLPPELLRKCSYDCKRNTRHTPDRTLQWTCAKRASGKRKFAEMNFGECPRECPGKCLDHASVGSHHRHNNKGHSYLSRFLIAAVPSKIFKKNDGVVARPFEDGSRAAASVVRGRPRARQVRFKAQVCFCRCQRATPSGTGMPQASLEAITRVAQSTTFAYARTVRLVRQAIAIPMSLTRQPGCRRLVSPNRGPCGHR